MKRSATTINETQAIPPIQALSNFCQSMGITTITAWRLRRRGWLQTVNICGRQYVTGEALQNFLARAQSGEFAQLHKTPERKSAA